MSRRQRETSQSPDDESDLLVRLKDWYRGSRDHWHDWRQEAKMCFAFVAGDQWDEQDRSALQNMLRPIITFNRVDVVVNSVAGLEVNNRQEVRYYPREQGDAIVNEVLTNAAKWARDECDAAEEESDAFRDLIVCGLGATETRIDYDEDPDGKPVIEHVDPMELFIDPSAARRNAADARYIFRLRDIPIEQARDMFPDADDADLDAGWARDITDESKSPHDRTAAAWYRNDQSSEIDRQRQRVRIVHAQWWEHGTFYRVLDPESGQLQRVDKDKHDKLQERLKAIGMPPLPSIKQRARVYKQAFIGSTILEELDGPKQGGFTVKVLTGKRDRNKGIWYGLVRTMIDPQKWANKWLSQALHIINTNAKGGVFAERDAFEDTQAAQQDYADPSAIVFTNPGALAQGKVQPRPTVGWPAAVGELMQFAVSSIRDVSGVNLEMLGLADREQAGVLEHQRKQAAMTVLAGMFDSLRLYRKEQGRLLLWYITEYLSDGRLIRIEGQSVAQYIPLLHQPGISEYDVIVDDAPSNVNQKEATWVAVMNLLPLLQRIQVPPQLWIKLLEYSPLPASLVTDIGKIVQQTGAPGGPQQHAPDPKMIEAQSRMQVDRAKAQQHQVQAQVEVMKGQAEVERTHADTSLAQAKAESERLKAQVSMIQAALDAQQAMVPQQTVQQ